MQHFSGGLEDLIVIEGNSIRGSFNHASGKSPLHIVDV